MTFGLKNAGATYQRAMNYIFHKLISRVIEIYIDDVMVKSKGYKEHLANLRETLECTRKHGLKMNPNKCTFCNTLDVTLYSLLLKHYMSIILMCKCV